MTDERETDVLVIGASAAGLAAAACLSEAGVRLRDPRGDRRTSATPGATTTTGCTCTRRSRPRRCRASRCRALAALPGARAGGRVPRGVRPPPPPRAALRPAGRAPRAGRRPWVATTADGTWTARDVVVATGATHRPVRPTWPGMEDYAGDLLHSSEYVRRRAVARTHRCWSSGSATPPASRRSTSWSTARRCTCRSARRST